MLSKIPIIIPTNFKMNKLSWHALFIKINIIESTKIGEDDKFLNFRQKHLTGRYTIYNTRQNYSTFEATHFVAQPNPKG